VAGAEQPSTVVHSASLDARALVALRFERSFVVFNAGYRFDRSAAAGANAPLFSPSDRLALGLSDFDAVLLGIGGGFDISATQLFAEATSDWLVGSGAPPFSESPLRLAVGARHRLSDALTAQLVLEGLLSARPPSEPSAPLVPSEPRASLFAGASYHFGATKRTPAATSETRPPPASEPKPSAPTAPTKPTVTALELSVVDDTGAPVPGARAHVSIGAYGRDLELGSAGHQREDNVPLGAAKIVVSAPGFEPGERSLELVASASNELRIELKALPPVSQVRGMVRSFGGAGLIAKVRVEPLGTEATTGSDGRFEIDVPPGSYEVVVEASGYQAQRRKINVESEGVVILNAELVKKK
ncbi:MAG TPA: carboxypeptidase regulatory-like domain-containing protein, partial [Polyangiaceae bacterium]|nr:carboxypeptidase regulatory-like domain-containing protein [Polyangiaceae bacterium]